MTKALSGAVIAATAAVLLLPNHAFAYCRTSSCDGKVGSVCVPAQPTDCGIPLFWPSKCVSFSVQEDGDEDVDVTTTAELTRQAFATWQQAECADGTHPDIAAADYGEVSCAEAEYNGEGKNANIVVFRQADWAYDEAAIALTTVTFVTDNGEIRDADIELNSERAKFTTSDVAVEVDLLSILTHETGHFLGLAHTPEKSATMFANYPPRSTTLRTLEPDDVAAICAAYPPSEAVLCDPTPRNGFGDTCNEPADEGPDSSASCTCSAGVGVSSSSAPRWLFGVGLVASGIAAISRRRNRPSNP